MTLTLCLLLLSFLSLQKYRITKRVGGGSFGDIYLGVGANGEKVRTQLGWTMLRTLLRLDKNLNGSTMTVCWTETPRRSTCRLF
jgi:hypothetical protein